jgi:CheY-like chemotaxis protein
LKILLGDDEPDIVYAVQKGLEMRGHSVDAFEDSEKALQEFKPDTYDIRFIKKPATIGKIAGELIDNLKVDAKSVKLD